MRNIKQGTEVKILAAVIVIDVLGIVALSFFGAVPITRAVFSVGVGIGSVLVYYTIRGRQP